MDDIKTAELRAISRQGSDADLPAAQRRTRATIVSDGSLTEGQEVTVIDGTVVRVLGPGRGTDWFLAGWQEEIQPGRFVDHIGTFHLSQIDQRAQAEASK